MPWLRPGPAARGGPWWARRGPAPPAWLGGTADTVLVDCLTLWVANQLQRGLADDAILAGGEALAKFVDERPYSLILVSNEVGEGVHPETASGLRFRGLLGPVTPTL